MFFDFILLKQSSFVFRSPAPNHCESGECILLQGEAALQTRSFRDADPHRVILKIIKENYGISSK